MAFLASYWWIFLCSTVIFAVLAIILQLRNLRRFTGGALTVGSTFADTAMRGRSTVQDSQIFGDVTEKIAEVGGGFFSRMRGVAICGILAAGSGVLTLIGVVVAILDYFAKR